MKILILYAGLGGNRKLWGDEHNITAIENNKTIAQIYSDYFPKDKVIVTDAHQYLLKHFKEFDFIWSSPPCQSHTKLNTASFKSGSKKYIYPEMELYQQIIFLGHWFDGIYVIENVMSYYLPLIMAQKLGRHLFWSNINLINCYIKTKKKPHEQSTRIYLEKFLGYNLDKYNNIDKRQLLRNCVLPEMGLEIFKLVFKSYKAKQTEQIKLDLK